MLQDNYVKSLDTRVIVEADGGLFMLSSYTFSLWFSYFF